MPGPLISTKIAACALIVRLGAPQLGWVMESGETEGEVGVSALPLEPESSPCISSTSTQFTYVEYEAQTS